VGSTPSLSPWARTSIPGAAAPTAAWAMTCPATAPTPV